MPVKSTASLTRAARLNISTLDTGILRSYSRRAALLSSLLDNGAIDQRSKLSRLTQHGLVRNWCLRSICVREDSLHQVGDYCQGGRAIPSPARQRKSHWR